MAAGQRAVVILDANTAAFNTKMKGAWATMGTATKKINRGLTSMAMKFGVWATAVGLAVGQVTKEAAKLQESITEIGTLMGGLADGEARAMREELQKLAVETGQSIEKLANARYDVVSAGFTKIGDSAKVMEAAAKSAVATKSSVDETADVITTSLNAYSKAAEEAMDVADILNVTIDKGKVRMNELANVMGRAIPLASELGIPIEQLSAAVAVLTKNGQDAREAVTGLRSIFVKMLKPTTKTNEVLEEIGASSLDALIQSRGLQGSLEALKKGAGALGYSLADVINRARGMTAAFPLAGGSASEFNEILSAINDSAGATNEDFKDMKQTLMNLMKRGWQKLKTIMIDIGYEVMPAVRKHFEDFLNYLDKNGTQIVKDWGEELEKHLNIIIKLVKTLNKLMPILIGYFSASILVSVINNLAQIWTGIKMIGGVASNIFGAGGPIVLGILSIMGTVAALRGELDTFIDGLKDFGKAIYHSFQGVGNLIMADLQILAKEIAKPFLRIKEFFAVMNTWIRQLWSIGNDLIYNLLSLITQKLFGKRTLLNIKRFWNTLKGFISGVVDKIGAQIESLALKIEAGFEFGKGHISMGKALLAESKAIAEESTKSITDIFNESWAKANKEFTKNIKDEDFSPIKSISEIIKENQEKYNPREVYEKETQKYKKAMKWFNDRIKKLTKEGYDELSKAGELTEDSMKSIYRSIFSAGGAATNLGSLQERFGLKEYTPFELDVPKIEYGDLFPSAPEVEEQIKKTKKKVEEGLTKTEKRILSFAQTMSSRFSSALTQMIDESKFSFQAIAQSFGRMLKQMAAELAAKAIIFESFKLLSAATGWGALGTALGTFSEFAFGDMGKTTAPVNTQTRTLNIDKNISSGDNITVNYNPTVQSIDSKDAKRYFMTEGRQALVDNIDHAVKNRQSKTLKVNK